MMGASNFYNKFFSLNFIKIFAVLFCVGFLFFGHVSGTRAASEQCGPGSVPEKLTCACGDTVVGNYTLPGDLSCTGHGLLVGANGITINGAGHSVTGDGGTNDYGIYDLSGYDNVSVINLNISNFRIGIYFLNSDGTPTQVIQNTNISSCYYGISLSNSSSNNITGNIVSSNYYGISLSSSPSNTLASNTTNLNTYGIYLSFSHSNNLAGNTANSNYFGIYLLASTLNTLTSNIMSGNVYNLFVSGSSAAQYNNDINTSNKVEGKSVYYLYNKVGTAGTPFVYDGSVLGNDIGMFWAISSSYVQVKNATLSANNNSGVYFFNTTNSLIDNVVANSNYFGIYLSSSSSNILTGNTTSSNTYGLFLSSSSSNTLTSNIMSGNGSNLFVSGSSAAQYNNDINTSNKVEGKSVYYLYNKVGTAGTPFVYDGSVLGNDIGMFWAISSSYVQVKNATLSANNNSGVYFFNTTNSLIDNVVANSNSYYGISLSSSSTNTLTNNTTNLNTNGISLSSSSTNTLTGNTISSNTYGLFLSSSSSNTLTNNTASQNRQDLYNAGTTNTYSANHFINNITSNMFTFVEPTRMHSSGDTISFSVSSFIPDGATGCTGCTTVDVYPSETIVPDNTWASTNNPQGHFTASKSGTYSLIFTITDANLNTTKRILRFFVDNAAQSTTTEYYYRGVSPSRGQHYGNGLDSKTLSLTAPTSSETWTCVTWVQNSPNELPNYPLSNLSNIDMYTWYEQIGSGKLEIQRYSTYDESFNSSSSVPSAPIYTWVSKSFSGLNWSMDYSRSWYWISLKLNGSVPGQITFPIGHTAAEASYANFTYSYATTPAVKSISNEDVNILSATTPVDDTNNATIVLDYPLSGSASTSIVLGDPGHSHPFRRSFQGTNVTKTTVNSDGTVALQAIGIAGITTINSVPLDITPNTGTVDIGITTWNTSDTYSKEWTETASGSLAVSHTVGNLENDTSYSVKIDGATIGITGDNCTNGVCLSDGSGQIIFTYSGSYSSAHTFTVSKYQAQTEETIATPITSESVVRSTTTFSAPTQKSITPMLIFATDLKFGSIDNQIKILQIFLNQNGYILATSGAGSPGKETNYFGLLTVNALTKFQGANKITEKGYLGPKTKEYINSLGVVAPTSAPSFTSNLYKGVQSNDVRQLQTLLATNPEIYPEGMITGLYGSLTEKAIQRFQLKYKVVNSSSEIGYGVFGPKTRAKFNEVWGK